MGIDCVLCTVLYSIVGSRTTRSRSLFTSTSCSKPHWLPAFIQERYIIEHISLSTEYGNAESFACGELTASGWFSRLDVVKLCRALSTRFPGFGYASIFY